MYGVRFVEDQELPEGYDWCFVRLGGRTRLFIRSTAVCEEVIEQAWAAYREIATREAIPQQRERRYEPAVIPLAVGVP